jgi:hypothetical protein
MKLWYDKIVVGGRRSLLSNCGAHVGDNRMGDAEALFCFLRIMIPRALDRVVCMGYHVRCSSKWLFEIKETENETPR